MTDIPAGAQRSEDGHWWWDGSQWQPVATETTRGTTDAQPAQGSAAPAPTESVGQLSDDGQWQWDGTQWQPAHADATAASGSPGSAPGGRQITLAVPTAEARAAHDGTTAVIVRYSVTNSGTAPIAAHSVQLGFYVMAAGNTAENAAYSAGDMLTALAVGEEHQGHWPVQVDPGSWRFWVAATDTTTGEALATSDDVAVEVAGHRAVGHDFDDTQAYTLMLSITNVEHVEGALYRVHYDIQSDRTVPVGLKVVGRIEGGADSRSGQIYELTTAIEAGRPHAHYLTLEADKPSHSTAWIYLDPGGPSEKSESVVFDVAEDGTPTMSR